MIGAPDSSPSNCELPSYVQILEYSQVLEYPWLSRVPIQGKHIQDGDVPRCAQLNKCVCVREVINLRYKRPRTCCASEHIALI